MSEKILNQSIYLKEYITEKEYKEINELQEICSLKDKVNLKLELDYKLNIDRKLEIGLKNINEFLYYVDETLVAYLGISSFGANIGEINGMTHPDWRRKGIFKKLLKIAIDECNNRNFNKILLLTDGKSNSGTEFIKAVGGNYDFSEYRMKKFNKIDSESMNSISLRKAGKLDGKEIRKQNAIYFNDENNEEESEIFQEANAEETESSLEETLNEGTYMVELKDKTIGKINVEYSDNSVFISGFGILPDFRGKGYGKAALKEALRLINEKNINEVELDVECKNNTALNLYKSCGFEEKSVMNYYKYNIINM